MDPAIRPSLPRIEEMREVIVPRCPVCQSFQIVVVVQPLPNVSIGVATRPVGNARCSQCGSRWSQRGSEQMAIQRLGDGPSTFHTPKKTASAV